MLSLHTSTTIALIRSVQSCCYSTVQIVVCSVGGVCVFVAFVAAYWGEGTETQLALLCFALLCLLARCGVGVVGVVDILVGIISHTHYILVVYGYYWRGEVNWQQREADTVLLYIYILNICVCVHIPYSFFCTNRRNKG